MIRSVAPALFLNRFSVSILKKKVELISYRKKDVSGLDRVTQEVLLRGTLFNGLYRLSLPSEHKALLGEITPAYIWHLIYLI